MVTKIYYCSRVWQYAARAPQIHILSNGRASQSKVVSIVNSCVEAREAVYALKLDYFININVPLSESPERIGKVRNYVNLDVDTIWNPSKNLPKWSVMMPGDLIWICGKCNMHPRVLFLAGPYFGCEKNCLSRIQNFGNPGNVRRLAIRSQSWATPGHTSFNEHTLQLLFHCKVQEILLVVGDFESFNWQRDIRFVAPSLDPIETENGFSSEDDPDAEDYMSTWYGKEMHIEKAMQYFKKERLSRRTIVEEMLEGRFSFCLTCSDANDNC